LANEYSNQVLKKNRELKSKKNKSKKKKKNLKIKNSIINFNNKSNIWLKKLFSK
jgi:hypothetical protein